MPIERIQVLSMSVFGVVTNGSIGSTDMVDQSQKNALDVSGRVGTVEKTI